MNCAVCRIGSLGIFAGMAACRIDSVATCRLLCAQTTHSAARRHANRGPDGSLFLRISAASASRTLDSPFISRPNRRAGGFGPGAGFAAVLRHLSSLRERALRRSPARGRRRRTTTTASWHRASDALEQLPRATLPVRPGIGGADLPTRCQTPDMSSHISSSLINCIGFTHKCNPANLDVAHAVVNSKRG